MTAPHRKTLFREVNRMSAACPECAAEIELADVMEGEIVDCPECGVELEVLTVDPLTLGLAPEEEEDWGE
jgi:alpha-aminoadipate carrier protein LysW